jgi:hypothetical protein
MTWRILCLLAVIGGCPSGATTGTAAGTKVLEWNRGPTTFSTGIAIGSDVGAPISEQKIVTFTPKDARDESLGIVRVEVLIERGDVAIVANAAGERPAEQGSSPKRIEARLLENHGWTIASSCQPKLNGPGTAKPSGVQFTQTCSIHLSSGDDTGAITLSINGDGTHSVMGTFGDVRM